MATPRPGFQKLESHSPKAIGMPGASARGFVSAVSPWARLFNERDIEILQQFARRQDTARNPRSSRRRKMGRSQPGGASDPRCPPGDPRSNPVGRPPLRPNCRKLFHSVENKAAGSACAPPRERYAFLMLTACDSPSPLGSLCCCRSLHDATLPDVDRCVQNIFTIELIAIEYRYGTAASAILCGGW